MTPTEPLVIPCPTCARFTGHVGGDGGFSSAAAFDSDGTIIEVAVECAAYPEGIRYACGGSGFDWEDFDSRR